MGKIKLISIGDLIHDPIKNQLLEVCAVDRFDNFGQRAIMFYSKQKQVYRGECLMYSAWIVFKYFEKVGRI